jgi:hypothetical protein
MSGRIKPTPWFLKPTPPPPDVRDAEEHADVAAALAVLPADHPARVEYAKGAGTIALTHLVADRMTIVEALKAAYFAGLGRINARSAAWCTGAFQHRED